MRVCECVFVTLPDVAQELDEEVGREVRVECLGVHAPGLQQRDHQAGPDFNGDPEDVPRCNFELRSALSNHFQKGGGRML